jgi:hypothetical protein
LNLKPHEAQLEDQKVKKSSRRSYRRRESRKSYQMASQQKEQRKAQNHKTRRETTPPNMLNASSPLYIGIIMFLLSSTRLAKCSTNFVPILSSFGNELIKCKSREERDAMHKIQN